mmetsp:Transcript_36050/g.90461  ORF Transcript_36050/g.90461 Transcript_36050/m.90461 type:complete len:351 (+) Transcript_36050:71-1123(+)|eukprot:CAMPEP_0177647876 /NCGR_PEP_ID=MMETSP0447-20121125/10531_1 /TAXON_ID=0 /ORGANISM="Stygamoeba regulata, Strain BSH-02190019" /LENGTH=350 /DNA_ID=CAMNT_0019150485 /DNA_START=64 /DNA_END=1116 /DNA_ORIENTATION=+
MSTTELFTGYAAHEPRGVLTPFSYTPRPLGEDDVEIAITHCGVCASDVHQVDCSWAKASIFPMIPGHEIVGVVQAVGSKVDTLEVGSRVGVGPQCLCCFSCEQCKRPAEELCTGSPTFTYNSRYPDGSVAYGGYADRIRVHSRFAHPLPDALDSAAAAPLLCAGATTYSPLVEHGVGPGHHVAVVGLGGLGHLAVQFAKALGAEVTCVSSSERKRETCAQLGADHFLISRNPEEMAAAQGSFDFLVSTIHYDGIEWDAYMNLIKPSGTLIMLGLPAGANLTLPSRLLVSRRLRIAGGFLASLPEYTAMLKLCAEKNIVSWVDEMPMSEATTALGLLREGKLKNFRLVLKN